MIGFAGLSHLGLVSSVALASKGFDVLAYDPDAQLCKRLESGDLPVYEPGLAELRSASRGHIRFTSAPSHLGSCELVFVSRDVPTDEHNRSDLSALSTLIEEIAAHLSPGAVLVILSQARPGFTRQLAGTPLFSDRGRGVQLFYQVETLIFGRAVERALYPERFVVGCGDPNEELPPVYAGILNAFGCPILRMRYESAELSKLAINLCLVASVSVANTVSELCEAIGADWSEIVPVLKLDRRIGPHAYLGPGLGIAGGNLERDLLTVTDLAAENGTDARVVTAWLADNAYRRDWLLRMLHAEVFAYCANPTIALWGLAYKPDTTSIKNSPALALIEALGPCAVRAYDPQVHLDPSAFPNMNQCHSAWDACKGADVLAITTPWREFSELDLTGLPGMMKGRVIVDPYATLDGVRCRELGFRHFRLGSPRPSQEVAA